MPEKLEFGSYLLEVDCSETQEIPAGYLLNGAEVNIRLPFKASQYYRHGWQSWSLASWLPVEQLLPVSRPTILHPLQIDPGYAYAKEHNGSWVGAVRSADDQVLLLGALEMETHVWLHDENLRGQVETGEPVRWFLGLGPEDQVFSSYAQLLGERFGSVRDIPSPRVWCSWYSFYSEIDEERLLQVLEDQSSFPFDVFQVDDGWEQKVGDWEANDKFPSGMKALAEKIRAAGRTPGLWLAPLLVVPSSTLYRQHPDWLLRDHRGRLVSAGFNFLEQLYALDSSHPDVLEWLANLMDKIRRWGYDYIKLDFLYAGALPGQRHINMPRETAYRQALSVIRKTLGEAYFLTCGAPIIPSLGLCDGMRVGPDVAAYWESSRDARFFSNFTIPGTRNAIRTSLHRLWLNQIVHTDPDVAYFRSYATTMTTQEKEQLKDLVRICDYRATSDLPDWLEEDEAQELQRFLSDRPAVRKTGRYQYQIEDRTADFTETVRVPESTILDRILGSLLGMFGNIPAILKLSAGQDRQRVLKEIRGVNDER